VPEARGLETLNRPVGYVVEKSTKFLAQPLGSGKIYFLDLLGI
jgi:hypothetical protein